MSLTSHEIRLASRPRGWPTLENFEHATVELSPPADGQVLVRNLFMSVDPYMRGRMNDVKSYVPPFEVGKAMQGGAIGEVIESRAEHVPKGAITLSMYGWRDQFVAGARELQVVEHPFNPVSAHLGVLGMPGLTAWVGLNLVEVKAGDRVFVSGAAGAVGSIAGQLAKLRGCYVVGSAGSAEKVKVITEEFGFDAAFNYKDGKLREQLAAAAPEGIDVYFDNVGGEHLEVALAALRVNGRVSACGSISRYNDTEAAPGPRNMFMIVTKRLTIRGFIVSDWIKQMPEFVRDVAPLLASGKLRWRETVKQGLERAPEAFLEMLRGENIGKMVVKI